jgi:hypothetical protein
MEKINRYELVELIVPALTLGRVTFQTIPQLRNQPDQIIQIQSISVFSVTSYVNSQNTSSLPGMPVAEIAKAVLVLYVNGEESVKMIPLVQLIHVDDQGNPYQQELWGFDQLKNVDFDKSYVQFSVLSDASAYVIPFGISYIRFVKGGANGIPNASSIPPGNWVMG